MLAALTDRAENRPDSERVLTSNLMLSNKMKKQEGKKSTPKPAESLSLFGAKTDPATLRLLTPREQWTPAQKRAEKRAETMRRQESLVQYEQVQAQLHAGNLPEALRLVWQVGGEHRADAVTEVAQAQVQAGDLFGAVTTARGLTYPYQDKITEAVLERLLQQGDLAGAEWVVTIVAGFSCVYWLEKIAQAQQQGDNLEAARRTLVRARERAQVFGEGDMKNGYFRSYYLSDVVAAQLYLGDVAGATHTAQLIDRPEYQSPALRKIEEYTADAADTARRDAGLA